jgi:hypothetical protein
MKKEKITVTFNPDGTVEMDAEGFEGGECLKATQDLEKALGKVTNRTKKPEFHKKATAAVKIGIK